MKGVGRAMKALLINPPKRRNGLYVVRDECAIGTVPTNFLPSQIFLATGYLRQKGIEADAADVDGSGGISFDGYDVVVVWVCILHSFYQDIQFLKKAKEEGKRTVMVLNDSYDGLEMEAMQRFAFIDASVRLWEREIALQELVSSWMKGAQPDNPGLLYRSDEGVVDTGCMPYLPTLSHLSSCSEVLKEASLSKYESALITPGRGCPVGCSFCLYRDTALRKREIEDVISEIQTVVAAGVKKVIILDPAMPSTPHLMRAFCNELITRNIKVSWRTDARVEDCRPETLNTMKSAGCDGVMIGIESLDKALGEKVMAGTSYGDFKTAISNLRRADIVPIPVFYIGFPWDSDETLSKIKDFLREVPIRSFILKPVRPWRGTPYYEECKRLGLLKSELGIDDYVDSSYPITKTLHLSKEDIEKWKAVIFRSAKLNPRYMARFLLSGPRIELKHFKQLPKLVMGKTVY